METKEIQAKKVFVAKLKTTLKTIAQESEPVLNALMQDVEKFGIAPAGPLEYIYFGATNDLDKEFDLTIALPVTADAKADESTFSIEEAEAFKCATQVYEGHLDNMMSTYDELFKELDWNKIEPTDQIREVYQKWEGLSSDKNIVEIQIGIN